MPGSTFLKLPSHRKNGLFKNETVYTPVKWIGFRAVCNRPSVNLLVMIDYKANEFLQKIRTIFLGILKDTNCIIRYNLYPLRPKLINQKIFYIP